MQTLILFGLKEAPSTKEALKIVRIYTGPRQILLDVNFIESNIHLKEVIRKWRIKDLPVLVVPHKAKTRSKKYYGKDIEMGIREFCGLKTHKGGKDG